MAMRFVTTLTIEAISTIKIWFVFTYSNHAIAKDLVDRGEEEGEERNTEEGDGGGVRFSNMPTMICSPKKKHRTDCDTEWNESNENFYLLKKRAISTLC